jgi:hypothetical protein
LDCKDSWTLADAAFQADSKQFLGFHGKLHGQLAENFLAEAIDDHVDSILGRDTTLIAIENLILTNLTGGGFVFDAGGGVPHFDVWKGVRPALISNKQGITL